MFKSFLKAVTLLAFIVITIVVAGEAYLRLMSPSYEYLTPNFKAHADLGYHIPPLEAGHDEWGFRNERVPEQADTVVIGDSFAYGVSVSASQSWPAILAEQMGQPIYNMSTGGYGLRQYQYLLEEYALKLKPKRIILSLYLGDDLATAVKQLPESSHGAEASNPSGTMPDQKPFNFRHWLASHSFLYHEVVQSKIGDVVRYIEGWLLSEPVNNAHFVHFEFRDIRTIFTPHSRLKNIPLDVNRDFRNVSEVLLKMKDICVENGVVFEVAIFPTKERIFSSFVAKKKDFSSPTYDVLVEAERRADAKLSEFLAESGIKYVELYSVLSEVNETKLFYQDSNGHMTKNGHKIAAKRIKNVLFQK